MMSIQYVYDEIGNKKAVLIPIEEWNAIKKQIEEQDYIEPTKEEVLAGIKQGLKEAKLHQEGKIVLPKAKDIFNEL